MPNQINTQGAGEPNMLAKLMDMIFGGASYDPNAGTAGLGAVRTPVPGPAALPLGPGAAVQPAAIEQLGLGARRKQLDQVEELLNQ